MKLTIQKLEGWGYCMVKTANPNFNRFCMNQPCDGQTDGQTDRRNCDNICALSIDAVARKKERKGKERKGKVQKVTKSLYVT